MAFQVLKNVSDTLTRNNFVDSATQIAKGNPNKTPMLKEFNFNKLGEAALFHLSLYADVAKTEMAGLPESFSNKQQIYRGNKSQLLKIFDPTPYLIALDLI